MPKFLLSALFLVLLFFAPAGYAQQQSTKQAQEKISPVQEAYDTFTKDLGKPEKRHFGVLYGNYNLIQVVKTVKKSVDSAVTACGEKNPEMKEPLTQRFSLWKNAVDPVMKDAGDNIENMVLAQNYAKKETIDDFFKLLDDTRAEVEKETNRVPATTPEACQYLLEQMDETQETMVQLLRTTLISLPHAMQAEEEEEQEAEKKKAAEEPQL